MAHSNNSGALNVDDGPMLDGNTETTNYRPQVDPDAGNSSAVMADFTNFRAYKHLRPRGVASRPINLKLSNSLLADNSIGATFAANETFVRTRSSSGDGKHAPLGCPRAICYGDTSSTTAGWEPTT